MKQQERLVSNKNSQRDNESVKDEGFEIITEVSTRKESHTGEHTSHHGDHDHSTVIDFEDYEEDEDNGKENTAHQKLISPIEVKDHIEKLWAKEKDLLDIMFGRFYPLMEGEPYINDSLGS